jgi:hypothetical protein
MACAHRNRTARALRPGRGESHPRFRARDSFRGRTGWLAAARRPADNDHQYRFGLGEAGQVLESNCRHDREMRVAIARLLRCRGNQRDAAAAWLMRSMREKSALAIRCEAIAVLFGGVFPCRSIICPRSGAVPGMLPIAEQCIQFGESFAVCRRPPSVRMSFAGNLAVAIAARNSGASFAGVAARDGVLNNCGR